MDVGIGLPNSVVGVDRSGIVDWAQRAEKAGFSALGTIDRIAFPSYESLVALGAAAAVTDRISLVTDILLAPLRSAALLAKQAATLDSLSEGRLVLGLAPGGRDDDYELSDVDFSERGKIFDRQLEEMLELWKREGDFGPPASGDRPTVLIGGAAEKSFKRAAKFDGWTQGGQGPDAFKEQLPAVKEAWEAEGRDGEPRSMALIYFSLGDRAEEDAKKSLGAYYAWLGEYAEQIVEGAAKDKETLDTYLSAFEGAGCDEVICFPSSPDPKQVELLADAALKVKA
jgi:alkanesulfonate monooxygenase SsuD/methylene tetrahydromethanopterin reductase-like flavin-dependent oxidoreductase (luciferase family)